MVKSSLEQRIIDVLEKLAPKHDIDIVDVEMTGATKAPCVRVRLDKTDGTAITLDEVTANTAWVSAAIEELDPVSGSYTLEVSSPGMARPLRRASDFMRFVGHEIQVSTMAAEGRRKWVGSLSAATDDSFQLTLDDGSVETFTYDDIKKANLKPVYDFKPRKEGM